MGFSALARPPQSGTINGNSLSYQFGQASFILIFPFAFSGTPVVTLSLSSSSPDFPTDATLRVFSATATQFTGIFFIHTPDPVVVDTPNDTGLYNSLVVANGNPAICYFDNTLTNLRYVRATDAGGTAWGTPVPIDSSGDAGRYASLAVINGNPAISYYDNITHNLIYVRASGPGGGTWGNVSVTVDSTGDVGLYTSLATVNGNPAISYYETAATSNTCAPPMPTAPLGDARDDRQHRRRRSLHLAGGDQRQPGHQLLR